MLHDRRNVLGEYLHVLGQFLTEERNVSLVCEQVQRETQYMQASKILELQLEPNNEFPCPLASFPIASMSCTRDRFMFGGIREHEIPIAPSTKIEPKNRRVGSVWVVNIILGLAIHFNDRDQNAIASRTDDSR